MMMEMMMVEMRSDDDGWQKGFSVVGVEMMMMMMMMMIAVVVSLLVSTLPKLEEVLIPTAGAKAN